MVLIKLPSIFLHATFHRLQNNMAVSDTIAAWFKTWPILKLANPFWNWSAHFYFFIFYNHHIRPIKWLNRQSRIQKWSSFGAKTNFNKIYMALYKHSSVEMEGHSKVVNVLLPRMARMADRSRENKMVHCIHDSIWLYWMLCYAGPFL